MSKFNFPTKIEIVSVEDNFSTFWNLEEVSGAEATFSESGNSRRVETFTQSDLENRDSGDPDFELKF